MRLSVGVTMIIERIGRVTTWILAFATLFVHYAFAEKQWIWEISCKEKDYGTVIQYRVSDKRIERRSDFGRWYSIPSSRYVDVVVNGDNYSLFISSMSDTVHGPMTVHLAWWNASNSSLFNSYSVNPEWSSVGEVNTSVQYLNCFAESVPSERVHWRTGFIRDHMADFQRLNLNGDVWD